MMYDVDHVRVNTCTSSIRLLLDQLRAIVPTGTYTELLIAS
jgi:hypothetical protein